MLLTLFLKCFWSCFTFLHFLPDLSHLYTYTASYSFIHTLFCPPPKRKPRKQNQNQQTKTVRKKISPQNPWILCCVGQLLLGMWPTLNYGWYTHQCSIVEYWFSLSYQVPITSIRGGGYVSFPFSVLGFYLVWTCGGLVDAVEICLSS